MDVDPAQMPYLTWRWKVAQLPGGGDFRHASSDDQAAQVLVGFSDKRILTYIWDSNAPKGTMQSASNIPLVHIYAVVCQSGASEANKWIAESRNIAADYERAYGKPAPAREGPASSDQFPTYGHRRRKLFRRGRLPQYAAVMILVTGGTGFIGTHLLEKLVSQG